MRSKESRTQKRFRLRQEIDIDRDYHVNNVIVPLRCLRLGRATGTPASMLLVDTLSIEACRGHLSLPDESHLIT